ncbi:MAG TPA: NADP oxidoreductase [Candidatus Bathyarchaeia archaeon]|nr:NADP oxidoreductase [Candidatus Bathyarchaeia archaeon]
MKARIATVWLDGCSGCHMSLLDMDQRLLELADRIELVYSPLVDEKEFPENVDVTLVEGSISNEENLEQIRRIRERTKTLVSLGDCAVTGNVPSMRNAFSVDQILESAYGRLHNPDAKTQFEGVPKLLRTVTPVHSAVKVDVFVPGCPPSADVIHYTVTELLEGRIPDLSSLTRFGK